MSRRGYRKRREKKRRPKVIQKRRSYKSKKSAPKTTTPAPTAKTASSVVWENIVLHYLGKLKNAWKSLPDTPKSVASKTSNCVSNTTANDNVNRSCNKKSHTSELKCPPNSLQQSKSQNSIFSFGSDTYNLAKRKAISIVRNAIEYGQSKGIISRNGKFFWLKDDMSNQAESHISGLPDSQCRTNRSKKKVNNIKTKSCCSVATPTTFLSKHSSKFSHFKKYSKGRSIHSNSNTKRKLKAHFEDDSDDGWTCSRCHNCNMYY